MTYDTGNATPLETRLPQAREYWDGLADRITASAEPVLGELETHGGMWWTTLARRCPALAAAAAIAIAAGSIALGSTGPGPAGSPFSEVARAIGPNDDVGRLFASEPGPPAVETLMPVFARGETDR